MTKFETKDWPLLANHTMLVVLTSHQILTGLAEMTLVEETDGSLVSLSCGCLGRCLVLLGSVWLNEHC
jgi:hypothetical protein